MKIVGKKIRRVDGSEKAYGNSRYSADYRFDRMLVCGVKRAGVAHAILKKIDTASAERIDGIVKIATYVDVPGENNLGLVIDDMPLLVPEGGKIRYEGDAVALVVAEDEDVLEEALEKIEIDYEPLEVVLDMRKAIEDRVKIHDTSNVRFHRKIRRGNVEKVLKESYIVVSMDFETGYQEHAYLETQGILSVVEDDGSITIYGSMQCPFYVREHVSRILGLPQNMVNVVQVETGGAFGGKEDVPSYVAAKSALMAYLTKRPVKLIYRREEDFIETSKRHPSFSHYDVGFSKDGKITAVKAQIYLDMGAYATLSPIVMYRTLIHSCGAYKVDNVHVDVYGVYTNKVPSGAFRGFGSPQVLFAIETIMDEAAKRLGIDRWDIRYINALDVGDETSTGQRLDHSVGAKKTLLNVKEMSNYEKLKREVEEFNARNKYRKRGIGVSHIFYGVSLGAGGQHLDASGAEVHVHPDGSVTIMIGGTEMGQGARTTMAMIASEILGQRIEKIRVLKPQTSIVQDSGPTVASRTTLFSGNAVKIACEKIKDRMVKYLAGRFGVPESDVSIEYGYYRVGNEKIEFDEIAKMCDSSNVKLFEVGWFVSPKLNFDMENGVGEAYITYTYASQITLAEVDLLTGKEKVLEVWVSHDVGKIINLDGVVGQIHGGTVQGIGYALYEKLVYDEDGKMLTTNFNNYTIPTIKDVPRIHVKMVEEEYKEGPFGAKGIGEPSLMVSPPSVASAISDAVKVRFTRLPITPEEVILKLTERGG